MNRKDQSMTLEIPHKALRRFRQALCQGPGEFLHRAPGDNRMRLECLPPAIFQDLEDLCTGPRAS